MSKIIICALLLTAFFACKQEDIVLRDPDKINRPMNLAGPLINAHFSAMDLIEQIDSTQYLYVDSTGLLHVNIEEEFSNDWNDLIEYDSPTLDVSYDMPSFQGVSVTISYMDSIKLNLLDSMYFDSLFIKSAILNFGISAPSGYQGNYTVKFPGLIQANGDTIIIRKDLNDTQIADVDLSGARLYFVQDDIASYYTIETTINLTSVNNPSNQQFVLHNEIQNLNPDVIFGYFGTHDAVKYEQQIDFDFFESIGFVELVQFKGISIELGIENYLGVPLAISVDTLVFNNASNGSSVPLNMDDNIIKLENATYSSGSIVPASNNFSFNNENTNLDDAINIWADGIHIKMGSISNPDRDKSKVNFVSTDLELHAKAEIDIPFWFKTSNYERVDTLNFDLVDAIDSDDIDNLESLTLSFDFDNGLPFEINAQIYMATGQYQIIDSLFSDGEQLIWDAPQLDSNGKAIGTATTEVDISLTRSQVRKFHEQKTEKILIKTKAKTGGNDFVKLFADYTIDMHFGFEIVSGEINY